MRLSPTARVSLFLFGSGFCALAYQIVWLRLLRYIFGASTASTAAVLAIFMGGLGLGGILLGRRAERSASPLTMYGNLEIGISLLAAISPLLIVLVQRFYIALGGATELGIFGGTASRLVLAVVILGVPTTLMGGTLPAAARAVSRSADRGRRSTAWLYGMNTLGGVSGAMLTNFVFLEAIGIRKTILCAAALNLLVAIIARAEARKPEYDLDDAPGEAAEAAPDATADAAPDEARSGRTYLGFTLAAAAIVGFAFLVMELVWYRMLAPVLGGSSYTFGLILAVALLGIGLGGLLYGRGAETRRPTYLALSITCMLEAFFLIVPFALGDRLAMLAILTRPVAAAGFDALVVSWLVITGIVVLPASMISGYQFPLLIALLGGGRKGVGRDVGIAYAWNTWGAIIGSLAGGFLLLPLFSAPTLWRLLTVMLVITGAIALVLDRSARRKAWLPAALGLVAIALTTAAGPTAFWRHQGIGAGRIDFDYGNQQTIDRTRRDLRDRLIWESEGVEISVAVTATAGGDNYFTANGKVDGSARGDAATQIMSGLLGAIVHPEPKEALVIGLGTGSTAGWLGLVPVIDRVDVVELEPSIIAMADKFHGVNGDVLNNPKVHNYAGDGREFVLASKKQYHVIFSEPSNPYRAGIASLFSKDFYGAIADRLTDDGIFLQWVQCYEVDAEVIRTVYATLRSVFPYVETWTTHTEDLMLMASMNPITYDLDQLRARTAQEPYRRALRHTWQVEDIEGLFTGYIGNQKLADTVAATLDEDSLSTDDLPRLEFGFARNVGKSSGFGLRTLLELSTELDATTPLRTTGAPLDAARLRELGEVRFFTGTGTRLMQRDQLDAAATARRNARQLYIRSRIDSALAAWQEQDQTPGNIFDLRLVADGLANRGVAEATDALAALAAVEPIDAAALRAIWHVKRSEDAAAAEALLEAFEGLRDYGWGDTFIIRAALRSTATLAQRNAALGRQLFDALATPFIDDQFRLPRREARYQLAQVLDFPGLCREVLAAYEPYTPWNREMLASRVACYGIHDDPTLARAQAEYTRFLEQEPPALLPRDASAQPAAAANVPALLQRPPREAGVTRAGSAHGDAPGEADVTGQPLPAAPADDDSDSSDAPDAD
ncbi:MAG: fused MFS/spermidine synthase [Acidobacteriota bacterium]